MGLCCILVVNKLGVEGNPREENPCDYYITAGVNGTL